MLGIIVQLLVSWLLLWLFEKRGLGALGFYPTKKRLTGFVLFVIVTGLCCSSDFIMRMVFAKQQWQLNPKLTAGLFFSGVWWNIKSVLFEEFIFRGALMYILIKRLGAVKAIIISAICFGIYHWFSFEVIGNPVQMVIVFLMTGVMGLVYAYAYSKTFSLYYPTAIHLGWNLTSSFIFSKGSIGDQLLVQVKPVPEVTVGYFIYTCITFIPLLSCWLINFFMLKRMKQAVPDNKKAAG